jgi:membrane associated rhomboid family serine protease
MMRETRKSLKIYFTVVGVLGVLSGVGPMISSPNIIIKVFGIINSVLAIMFIYYGIKLNDYLQNSPKTLINFVVIALVIQVFISLLGGEIIYVIGACLLGWYLVRNIKKLSAQTAVIENK